MQVAGSINAGGLKASLLKQVGDKVLASASNVDAAPAPLSQHLLSAAAVNLANQPCTRHHALRATIIY